jgi:hypothetical protein
MFVRVNTMSKRIFTFAVVGFFICAQFAHAEMSSTNFKIRWDSISTGGSDTSSSASYQLRDTVDASAGVQASGSSYLVDSGYRSGIYDQIITFDVQAQDISDARSATALSGTTVTADETGLSVGDFVAVIQDQGSAQVTAIGKVASTGSGSITVDFWKNNGTQPTIDGTNDYVYTLSGTTIAFGNLSTSSVGTAVIMMEVSIENDSGYVVQIFEDGEFRNGSDVISDVSDGTVSSGEEEYGARSSDTDISTSTFDTADTAISGTYQDIATESSSILQSRNFLTLKAGISSSTDSGSYGHTLSIIASGNF